MICMHMNVLSTKKKAEIYINATLIIARVLIAIFNALVGM